MLHAFITANRDELLSRARDLVGERRVPRATDDELSGGIQRFLSELTRLLHVTRSHEASEARAAIAESAAAHARELFAQGLTIGQVVHDYGDVHQVIIALAAERRANIPVEELSAFYGCLDEAIAGAVTEYARLRERSIAAEGAERLGALAHEMRNLLGTSMLSFDAMKRGAAGAGGSLGEVHARSLVRLRDLIDRSLTEVRLDAEGGQREHVNLAELIQDEEIGATVQARAHQLGFHVPKVALDLFVDIDRQLVAGAIAGLLQNAFKFTRRHGLITLRTEATESRVRIIVEDECGGIQLDDPEQLLRPAATRFDEVVREPHGLAIARRAAQANGGTLHVTNLKGVGCRFTLELPRPGLRS